MSGGNSEREFPYPKEGDMKWLDRELDIFGSTRRNNFMRSNTHFRFHGREDVRRYGIYNIYMK